MLRYRKLFYLHLLSLMLAWADRTPLAVLQLVFQKRRYSWAIAMKQLFSQWQVCGRHWLSKTINKFVWPSYSMKLKKCFFKILRMCLFSHCTWVTFTIRILTRLWEKKIPKTTPNNLWWCVKLLASRLAITSTNCNLQNDVKGTV